MRRILALLALVLWGLATPAFAGERVLVGFAQDTLANDWRAAQVRQFQAALAGNPRVELVVTNAEGSTAQQMMDIERLVAQGVRILVTSPRDGKALAPALAEAHRRGVKVVLLTRRAATDDFTTFIAPDDHEIGRRAADYLGNRLKGSGTVLMLPGIPTASTAQARAAGFRAGLAAFPGIRLIESRPANFLRADALQVVEELLAAGTRFDAIFAQSDSMAAGARMALRGAGIDPASRPTIGIDYIPESRKAILAGEQEASLTYPTCATEGADIVLRLAANQPVPRQIVVDSTLVTRANAHDVPPVF